ncbi:MAG: 30S ribosomal protein S17 [Verrucomicrobiales bacterium]|nr:30S ribosomal protein S17 [Verrucomicrobiales bacterium]MEC5128677.1 30S ribosomal protein S17 [Verrucomicrobiales bacterium BCK34]
MSDSENQKQPGLQKTRVGVVTSDGMTKTIVVEVMRRVPHPRFKKIVKKTSKFFAHDEEGQAKVGDRVLIGETKPRSKKKCWELKEVLSH